MSDRFEVANAKSPNESSWPTAPRSLWPKPILLGHSQLTSLGLIIPTRSERLGAVYRLGKIRGNLPQ